MKKSTTDIDSIVKRYNRLQVDIQVNTKHRKDCENDIFNYINKNGPFSKDGYYFYLRREYTMKIINPQMVKKKYPEIFEECSRTITVKPKMIRRIDHA